MADLSDSSLFFFQYVNNSKLRIEQDLDKVIAQKNLELQVIFLCFFKSYIWYLFDLIK